jgi:hypothetical protein
MPKLVSVLCAVLLAVTIAGCGSSGSEGSSTTTKAEGTTTTADPNGSGSGEGEPSAEVSGITAEEYTEAFVTNLSSGDDDGTDLVVTEEQAECVAPKWVAAITVEKLHEAGATVEALSDPGFNRVELALDEDQGAELVAAFDPCGVDLAELFAAALTQGLTEEQQSCAVENIDREDALDYLGKSFGGSQPDLTPIQDALVAACDLPA